MFDPRLNPYRPDLAAAYLRGQVEASRCVDGTPYEVIEPVADVRRDPAHEAALDTQALKGERVTVYEMSEEGWARGQLAADGSRRCAAHVWLSGGQHHAAADGCATDGRGHRDRADDGQLRGRWLWLALPAEPRCAAREQAGRLRRHRRDVSQHPLPLGWQVMAWDRLFGTGAARVTNRGPDLLARYIH